MDLVDYLGGKASLTEFEAQAFGLGELTKGWKKRGKFLDITEDMINLVVSYYEDRQVHATGKKAYNRAMKALRKIRAGDKPLSKKYLYVMENTYGDLKIGISIDPFKRARALTTTSGSTVNCVAYWDTELPALQVESFLLKHYKAFRKEGEWFEPHSFTLEDVSNMIPCKKTKIFDSTKGKTKAVGKNVLTDTEEYEYLHIKHETQKAFLFNILGHDIWLPKSSIKTMNPARHLIKVKIGMISDKLKVVS